MQSDTIIGIVGAMVLVTVMVGVFAYEYSNAPEPLSPAIDPDSSEGKMLAFAAAYPSLNASDDLDGDSLANYEDDDIDGDGISNADDDDVLVHTTFSGNVATRTPANNPVDASNKFVINSGFKGGMVKVTWTFTSTPTGAPPDELTVSITGPGDIVCDNSANGEAICDLAPAVAGEYTIEVRHSNLAAQAKGFEGEYHLQY